MEIKRSHFGLINRALQESDRGVGFSWGIVRAFGELQILSRASYFMLLLVPLLAGLWPTVTTVVNQYNSLIETAAERLEVASDKLEIQRNAIAASKLQIVSVNETLSSLKADLDKTRKALGDLSIKRKTLPAIWALSFIASLCTVIAQVIYQVSAPGVVKKSSLREYINSAIDEEMKLHSGDTVVESAEIHELISRSGEEYRHASHANIGAAALSMVFYLSAVLLIGYIIFDQSVNVVRAAGWIS